MTKFWLIKDDIMKYVNIIDKDTWECKLCKELIYIKKTRNASIRKHFFYKHRDLYLFLIWKKENKIKE
jgi:hypothetical protein